MHPFRCVRGFRASSRHDRVLTVHVGEVTSLEHEVGDDAVERAALQTSTEEILNLRPKHVSWKDVS